MSRVLGDLIQEGSVAKIADDLYVGGNTLTDVLQHWHRVLALLQKNNLRLSASKTVICPKQATVLGWIWSTGTLQASPHKLAALSSAEPPATVQGLRSFVGAYKVLIRVLPKYSDLLDPLDQATAGRESREKLTCSDELLLAFKTAQKALQNHKTILYPKQAMRCGSSPTAPSRIVASPPHSTFIAIISFYWLFFSTRSYVSTK